MLSLTLVLLSGIGILAGWPIAPYGNNLVTVNGISIGQQEAYGAATVIWPVWARLALTFSVNCCVATAITWFIRAPRTQPRYRGVLIIFGLFTISYLGLIVPGVLIEVAFDRYMLPIVPLALILVCLAAAERIGTPPGVAWACLLVIGGYSVATTHDYHAGSVARLSAAQSASDSGKSVSAGFEYDGWHYLETSKTIRGSQYSDLFADDSPKGFWIEFWNHPIDMHPDLVVLNWTRSNSPPPDKIVRSYTAWIPPFRRSVIAWNRSELTDELQAARLIAGQWPR